jgi:signal transduction histidine kinase
MRTEIIKFDLQNEMDVVLAHKRAIQIGELTGLSIPDQTRYATAVSEIVRNCIEYAKKGAVVYTILCEKDIYQLETTIMDEGPGIPDIDDILERTQPTHKGRGMGLVYSRRLVDQFKIDTSKQGTRVYLVKKLPQKHPPINNLIIKGWAEHFKKEVPVSPYEEIKKRNMELLELAEKLRIEKFMVEYQMKEINRLNNELKNTNEDLKEFAYAISHDLKNPLATLKLRAALYKEAPSDEDKKRNFEAIDSSINRLESTVEGLIEIIDVQGKRADVAKNIKLEVLLSSVESEFEHLLEEKHGEIIHHLDVKEFVYIEAYIKSTLSNIISNAIKYSAPARNLQISINSKKEDGFVVLEVRDNGIGMDLEKEAKNLFKPFSRFNRTTEGKGIGLYIIKNMIEKNGGKVTVSSKPGEGTAFKFFLQEYSADGKE